VRRGSGAHAAPAAGDGLSLHGARVDGSARVPRYWLARTLFRIGLHRPLLGYVETYGGFFFDDREAGHHRIGVRGLGEIALSPPESLRLVETLYRAVAPDGYSERLDA
jgi:hypothetical protein